MTFGLVLIRFLQSRQWWWALVLVPLWFGSYFFHISALALAPSLILALVLAFLPNLKLEKWTFRNGLKYALALMALAGALGYLYLMDWEWVGPRSYEKEIITERLFLPVISSEPAPYDRYNLFSPNHFIDLFNLLLSYSAGLVLVLVGSAVVLGKKKLEHRLPVLITAFNALAFVGTFFLLNPLLSMPIDWDLMMIPAVPLLLLGLLLVREIKSEGPRWWPSAVIGLAGLTASMLVLHAHEPSVRKRVFAMGTWIYKTYYIGASSSLISPINNLPPAEQDARLTEVIDELRPWSAPGNDVEMAGLLNELAGFKTDNDLGSPEAERLLVEALEMDPLFRTATFNLISVKYVQKDYEAAYSMVDRLVQMGHPDIKTALRTATEVSVAAGKYDAARNYCGRWMQVDPQNSKLPRVWEQLNGPEPEKTIEVIRGR